MSLKWSFISLILYDLQVHLKYTTGAHLTQLLIFHMLDVSDSLKRQFTQNYHSLENKRRYFDKCLGVFFPILCFSPYNGHQ